MRKVKFLILRTSWRSNANPNKGKPAPDLAVAALFGVGDLEWSLRAYFRRATYGQVDFLPPDIIHIGSLPADAPVPIPGQPGKKQHGLTRKQVIWAALNLKPADVLLAGYDGVIVWLDDPSPGGALGTFPWRGEGGVVFINAAVLDASGGLTYFQHEVGHVLGFGHSHGQPAAVVTDEAGLPVIRPDGTVQMTLTYQDPACIMSAATFGGQAAAAPLASITGTSPGSLVVNQWGSAAGPLPAAATSYIFGEAIPFRDNVLPVWRGTSRVVDFAGWRASAQTRRLFSPFKKDPAFFGKPLARVGTLTAEGADWFIEYRTARGWDVGLAHTGVQVRRRITSAGDQPATEKDGAEFVGEILIGDSWEGDLDWTSPGGTFTVSVARRAGAEQSGPWIDVVVSPTPGTPQAELTSTVEYGPFTSMPLNHGTRDISDECFSGVYEFDLEGAVCSVTLSVLNYGFTAPRTTWNIDGKPITGKTKKLSPRGTYPSPEGKVTAKADFRIVGIATSLTELTCRVASSSGARSFEVSCTVEETSGPRIGTSMTASTTVDVDGVRLRWEDRYYDDFGQCVLRKFPRAIGALWRHQGPSDGPDMAGTRAIAEILPAEFDDRDFVLRALSQRYGVDFTNVTPDTRGSCDVAPASFAAHLDR
jgi:hypothetical protein